MYNVYPFEMCDTKKKIFAPPPHPKFVPMALRFKYKCKHTLAEQAFTSLHVLFVNLGKKKQMQLADKNNMTLILNIY